MQWLLPRCLQSLPPAACLLVAGFAVFVGCRDRAVGYTPPDAGVDASFPDGALDASPPDGGRDAAPNGCQIPSAPTVVLTEGAPAFAYTLERLPGGEYLLAGGVGWSQDLGARLFALDGETLEIGDWVGLDGTMAYAAYHEAAGLVVAADVADNRTSLRWFTPPSESPSFQSVRSYLLCESCSPFFSAPVGGELRVATAVEMFDTSQVMLISAERHGDGSVTVSAASALPGAMPTVVPVGDELLLLYLEEGRLMAVRYDWYGAPSFPARAVEWPGAELAFGLSATASPSLDGAYASLFVGEETPRDLVILRLDFDATLLAAGVAPEATLVAYESATAVSRGLVGVTWGETFGTGRVGAHVALFDAEDLSLAFGPSRISPPIGQSSSSYSVWSTLAPHPEGFAAVWGAWQEVTNYGLYGMILRCADRGLGP